MSAKENNVAILSSDLASFPCLAPYSKVTLPEQLQWSAMRLGPHYSFNFEMLKTGIKRFHVNSLLQIGKYEVRSPFPLRIKSICLDENTAKLYLIDALASVDEIQSLTSYDGHILFLNSSMRQLAQSLMLFEDMGDRIKQLQIKMQNSDQCERNMEMFKEDMVRLDANIWDYEFSYWREMIEEYLQQW